MGSAVNTRVVSFEEARRIVEEHAAKASLGAREAEEIDLTDACGRVLAEAILADRDYPAFARATRDGYAVRSADLVNTPARLEVVGEIKAGDWPDPSKCCVGVGQAVEIMTGAPLPEGADAVVMVEYTEQNSSAAEGTGGAGGDVRQEFVEVKRGAKAGDNFVMRGAEARAGDTLAGSGTRLEHGGIAMAASAGKSRMQVYRKPRVAILSTGDELVEIEEIPGAAQIRNSNSYSLAAQVQEAGGDPVRLPIARDERGRLRTLILEGLRCDLLLMTGGVSMGRYDLVEQVLGELGATFYFTGAEIQPGRPIVFGSCAASDGDGADASRRARSRGLRERYFLGLPGNPVSTMVTFELFARPMIEAMAGMTPRALIFLRVPLKSTIRTKTGLKRFLPAILTGKFEQAEVELARWQGSGDIAALARANCYIVIPPDRDAIEAGEFVNVMMR